MILRLALAIIISAYATAQPASTSSLVTYIFGDSLTEVGNNNYLQYSLARADFPYYGVDFSGGKVTGRFTNGRTIGDIICALSLSLSPFNYVLLNICIHTFSCTFMWPSIYTQHSSSTSARVFVIHIHITY